jgi:spermidine/putrescine transport system substrate-binding protein
MSMESQNATPASPPRSSLSRRHLLGGAAALGVGAAGAAWAQRSRSGAQTDGERRTLKLLCWQGYDDRAVTRAFREQYDVEIEATYLGANDEIFTFLRAGGLGQYDVVTPHNGIVKALVDVGLLDPLDVNQIPQAEDLFPRFQWPDWVTVDDQVYGAPFLWGTSPMVYSPAKVSAAPQSWLDIQATKYRGRIVMTEDGIGHFMIWNGVLGNTDPTRVTTNQLNETTDLLISLKRDRAGAYVGPMNEVARLLAQGTVWVSTIGWDSTPYLDTAKGANLRTSHPKPGDYSYCDNLCIAHNAPNPDLAHAFIDYMVSPDVQADVMNRLLRGTVNARAVESLNSTAHSLYAYDDLEMVFDLSPLRGFPPFQDEGDGIATYVDWVAAWERVRFTQMKQAR